MNQQHWLLAPTFLLIFGPKISGWIDVVSITSMLLVVGHLFFLNTRHVPRPVIGRVVLLLGVFAAVFVYVGALYLRQWDGNPFQALRFGRVAVNSLGVVALVSLYYRFAREPSVLLAQHIYHTLVIHAAIMLCMFLSTPFRELIVNRVVQADPDSRTYLAKALGYRIAGLTDSWDALSGLQSLGLLMIPLLLTHRRLVSYPSVVFSVPLLLFSVAISGRTGFVTLALLLPVTCSLAEWRNLHRIALVAAGVTLLTSLSLAGPLRSVATNALQDSSIGRTLGMFGWQANSSGPQSERFLDTLTSIWHEHYFLPDSRWVTLFGTGGSGRDASDYVPADNGPVLNLHNLGLCCVIPLYGLLLWMARGGLAARRQCPHIAGLCVLATSLVLLIDVKVMYAYSRNGFSVMFLPAMAVWWETALRSRARPPVRVKNQQQTVLSGPVGAPACLVRSDVRLPLAGVRREQACLGEG